MWKDWKIQCVPQGDLNLGENNPWFELYVTGTVQQEPLEPKEDEPHEEPDECGGDSIQVGLGTQQSNIPLPLSWVTTSRDGAQVINCSYLGKQCGGGLWNRGIISVHVSWDRGWWLMTCQSLFQGLSQPLQKECALSPQLIGSYHLSSYFDQQLKLKKKTQLDSYQSSWDVDRYSLLLTCLHEQINWEYWHFELPQQVS